MFNINKKLTKWADAGLISESQKQNILKYQDSQNSSPWVLYGFGLLGAVAIGIGLISVISANWNFIPSYIKLSVNWILLLATACGAYYSYSKNKPLLFEVLLTFLFIQTIASIGLIAQVYNLNGSFSSKKQHQQLH